jgi:tetratricopeptide (TPR) repeat protein
LKQTKRINFIILLILITVNLAVFLPSMNGDFLWDDKYFISDNPYILAPHFLQNLLITPFGGLSGMDENSIRLDRSRQFYRPFSSLSYWLDLKIWGFNPAGFHLTNILLHMINTIILYFLLLNIGLSRMASFLSSLLFSLFPFHFENVSWISGRTDLLSFLFASLSVLFFIKFLKRKNYVLLILSSCLYLFSLLSKESNIFLIMIYFFLIYLREPKFKDTFIPTIPFVLSFLAWLILRSVALGSRAIVFSGRTLIDFLSTIGFYFFRLVLPFNLSFTIDSYQVFQNVLYQILGGIMTLLFIASAILILIKKLKNPKHGLALFSFYLLLLPSVVIIFFSSTVSVIAWRFLYLPSALFLSYLVYILFKKIKVKAVPMAVVALLCVFYTAEIYPKNKVFGKNETDFWLSFKNIEREDLIARFNIGVTYLPIDENKAMYVFNNIFSQKDHPFYKKYEAKIYEDLAQYYTFKKDFETAEKYFNKLRQIRRHQSQHFYFTYANFLAFQGKIPEGEGIVTGMLDLFPENHLVLFHSAVFYMLIENYEKASELLEKDYRLFPTRETLRFLKKLEEERKNTLQTQ